MAMITRRFWYYYVEINICKCIGFAQTKDMIACVRGQAAYLTQYSVARTCQWLVTSMRNDPPRHIP
jgi:hypothetical protein